jgi:NADH-quinone oxidoreductase subunit C
MTVQEYTDALKATLCLQLGLTDIPSEIQYDIPVIVLPKEKVHDALKYLKSNPELGYTFLTTLAGIHFPDNIEKEFGLMYQVHNMQNNKRLRIRTYMPKSDLNIPTITDIWAAANWMEREAFDFYGFNFVGHPQLERILNMNEMNYHPLRKEYALEDSGRIDKDDKYFGR